MDAKRAVGGFCTFVGGTVVNIIQATQPSWFGNHAWILPASSVVLFVGLLVWLCQYRWAQRVLGIVQSQKLKEQVSAPSSPHSSEAILRPSRLEIIESRYGIDGGPDPEVTEQYIKPRIYRDTLVGFVGADLFGGFQPHIGPPPKRLKVRYRFDGEESMVVRGEGEMIVLPEDRFLKKQLEALGGALLQGQQSAQKCKVDLQESAKRNLQYREQILELISDSVSESDPLVYPEFTDARATTGSDKKENEAYFTLVNRGASEARNIVLEPLEMDGLIVQFTRNRIAAPLLPNRETYFYPDVVTKDNKSVTEIQKDLFGLFCRDYLALGDSTISEATKSVKATYQDSARNLFEVTCELIFDPSAHADVRIGNRGTSPVIRTRNHKFRKVARAIPLLEEKQSETGI